MMQGPPILQRKRMEQMQRMMLEQAVATFPQRLHQRLRTPQAPPVIPANATNPRLQGAMPGLPTPPMGGMTLA